MVFHEHHFPFHFKDKSQSPFPHFYLLINTLLPSIFDIPYVPTQPIAPIPILSQDTSNPSPTFAPPIPMSPPSLSPLPHPPRCSGCVHKALFHLQDYICNSSTDHWFNIVNFDSLPQPKKNHIASQCIWKEPFTYKEVIANEAWQSAMQLNCTLCK